MFLRLIFLPYRSNKEIVSGGNDADIRYYDLEKKLCTGYSHHTKKVLRLSINPHCPDTFLSCSADGTIRMIDIRQKYASTYSHTFDEYDEDDGDDYVLPQAFGGGRASRLESDTEACQSSLLLDYKLDHLVSRPRRLSSPTLFSVDIHPDGNRFIVGSAFGNVRLYDLRKIIEHNPAKSYINIYSNCENQPNHRYLSNEITGCVFSKDGSEIVATQLNNFIYVFDVETNYSKVYNLDYFTTQPSNKRPKRRVSQETKPEKSTQTQHETESRNHTTESSQNIQHEKEKEKNNGEEEGDEEQEESAPLKTYKDVYKGHFSSKTIKSVNFYGPKSEFVISGSDDAKIYIWDKSTTELLTILEGHDEIVNCIVGHPTQPMIASSGIDNVVKLWQNMDDCPSSTQLKKRKLEIEKTASQNINLHTQEPFYETICAQQ